MVLKQVAARTCGDICALRRSPENGVPMACARLTMKCQCPIPGVAVSFHFTSLAVTNAVDTSIHCLLNSQASPWTIYRPPRRPFGLLRFANSTHISIQPTTSTPWRPTTLLICPTWMKWIKRMSIRTALANKMSRLLAVPCRSVLSIPELAICCC